MNLTIDFGNSTVKAGIFSENELIEKIIFREDTINQVQSVLSGFPEINRCILSSVSLQSEKLKAFLKKNIAFFILLDQDTPLPIKSLYESQKTLGYDRIASAVGAYTICPSCNVLIIDAGTAITFDLVNNKGEFIGGNISPGREMRAKALNNYTSRLPLVETDGKFPLMAKNTIDALKSGIMNGIIFETEGYIKSLSEKYEGLKIFLTGGDAKYFDKKLNYSIFVDSNLNLKGLNSILEHNAS